MSQGHRTPEPERPELDRYGRRCHTRATHSLSITPSTGDASTEVPPVVAADLDDAASAHPAERRAVPREEVEPEIRFETDPALQTQGDWADCGVWPLGDGAVELFAYVEAQPSRPVRRPRRRPSSSLYPERYTGRAGHPRGQRLYRLSSHPIERIPDSARATAPEQRRDPLRLAGGSDSGRGCGEAPAAATRPLAHPDRAGSLRSSCLSRAVSSRQFSTLSRRSGCATAARTRNRSTLSRKRL